MYETIIEFCLVFLFAVLVTGLVVGLFVGSNVLAKKIKTDDDGLLGLAMTFVGLFFIGFFAVIISELRYL